MTTGPGRSDPAAPVAAASSSLPRPPGLVLHPFRALRYDPEVAGDLVDLTSPPYDVLDADAVSGLERASGLNVVRLILPREQDGAPGDRYAAASARLVDWRRRGVLRPDPEPALYVYEQARPDGGHVQRGLVGALALAPPEAGIVLPHESTMPGPVDDRLRLYEATGADLEPIFLVYDGGGAATEVVAGVDAVAPLVDAHLPDGLRHRLWAVTDPAALAAVADDLLPRTALIADGHHRYATYLRRQADRHAAGSGAGPWDAGLCLLVDAASFGPEVHPIHRVLPGVPAAELAARAQPGCRVEEVAGGVPEALLALEAARRTGPAFVLADGARRAWLLSRPDQDRLAAALPQDRSAAWRSLDVTVLHRFVVQELWGVTDDEATVGFEHDVEAALRRAVETGGTAVLLGAATVEQVAAVAAAGDRMPRKSTLFTPKPRSGVLLRDLRDA